MAILNRSRVIVPQEAAKRMPDELPFLYDGHLERRGAMAKLGNFSESAGQPSYAALLRGINVGGKNKLPMRELAALFAGAGCREVQTYLQSGNVVFAAEQLTGLEQRLAQGIEAQFGLRVPVVLRSAEEMRRVLRSNPFVKARVPEEMLHVYFLADDPDTGLVERLDQERSPGDTFVVVGREIYLHLSSGVAGTKLSNVYFDRALGTVSTMRNWRTVGALAGMLGVA